MLPFTLPGPLGVRRSCVGGGQPLRSHIAPADRMSILHRRWQSHVLCRCTVRSFMSEGESHTMDLHGMQLTLIPELTGTADVLPLPFA